MENLSIQNITCVKTVYNLNIVWLQDILEFIENSPHGVILMTFGSTVKMASIPDNIQQTFKEVLAQLPQRVLLKYEEEMKNKPKNVMISKWFPQRDILGENIILNWMRNWAY